MAYNFEERHDLGSTRMLELNSRPVQYRRGGSVLFSASATTYEVTTDEKIAFGASVDVRYIDFLFNEKDLPGGFVPQNDRDEIVDTVLGMTCKVVPLGEEACFRWRGHTRRALRVHALAPTAAVFTNLPPTVSLENEVASLPENADVSIPRVVASILITDDGVGDNDLAVTGPDASDFFIVSETLLLITDVVLTEGVSKNCTVTVNDVDVEPDPNDTVDYTLMVTAPTAPPPEVTLTPAINIIAEDKPLPEVVSAISVDFGNAATNVVEISGANDGADFDLFNNDTELRLKVGVPIDAKSTRTCTVTVYDSAQSSTPQNSAVFTLNTNFKPTVSLSPATLPSLPDSTDTTSDVPVSTITITDPDGIGSNALGLDGVDAANFVINGMSLDVKAGTILGDQLGSMTVDVTVNDPASQVDPDDTATFNVTITSVPTLALSGQVAMLPYDQTNPTKVADITVSDGDSNNVVKIGGANGGLFELANSSTELQLKASTDLNAQGPTITCNVFVENTAWPGGTPGDDEDYTLTINHRPTIGLSGDIHLIPRDIDTSAGTTKMADITISDDANGTNVITHDGTDAASFTVVDNLDNTGELLLKQFVDVAGQAGPFFDVNIKVNDASTNTNPDDTLAYHIDINYPPSLVLSPESQTIPDNTSTTSDVPVSAVGVTDDAFGTNIVAHEGANVLDFKIVGDTSLEIVAGTDLTTQGGSMTVDVTVNDATTQDTPDDLVTFNLTITSAPTLSLVAPVAVLPYDEPTPTKVADISVVGGDGSNEVAITPGGDAALFELFNSDTELRLKSTTDLDAQGATITCNVAVSNATWPAGVPGDDEDYTLAINHRPTVSVVNEINFTGFVSRDIDTGPARIKVADISIADDVPGTNTPSISGGDSADFEIIVTELFLKQGTDVFNQDPGASPPESSVFAFDLHVNDPTTNTTPDDTVAYVLGINYAPTLTLTPVVTELPDEPDPVSALYVCLIVVNDDGLADSTISPDNPGNVLSLGVGADEAHFTISSMQLLLNAGTDLSAQGGSMACEVIVTDATVGTADSQMYNLTITPSTITPPTVSLSGIDPDGIPHDTPLPLIVATINVVQGTNPVTPTLSGSDAAEFSIINDGADRLQLDVGADLGPAITNKTVDVDVDDPATIPSPDDSARYTGVVNQPPGISLVNPTPGLPDDTDTTSRVKVSDILVSDASNPANNVLTVEGTDAAQFDDPDLDYVHPDSQLYLSQGVDLDTLGKNILNVTVRVRDSVTLETDTVDYTLLIQPTAPATIPALLARWDSDTAFPNTGLPLPITSIPNSEQSLNTGYDMSDTPTAGVMVEVADGGTLSDIPLGKTQLLDYTGGTMGIKKGTMAAPENSELSIGGHGVFFASFRTPNPLPATASIFSIYNGSNQSRLNFSVLSDGRIGLLAYNSSGQSALRLTPINAILPDTEYQVGWRNNVFFNEVWINGGLVALDTPDTGDWSIRHGVWAFDIFTEGGNANWANSIFIGGTDRTGSVAFSWNGGEIYDVSFGDLGIPSDADMATYTNPATTFMRAAEVGTNPYFVYKDTGLVPLAGGTFSRWDEDTGNINQGTWSTPSGATSVLVTDLPAGIVARANCSNRRMQNVPAAGTNAAVSANTVGVIYASIRAGDTSTTRVFCGMKDVAFTVAAQFSVQAGGAVKCLISGSGGQSAFTTAAGVISQDRWYKLAIRQDGVEPDLYIDGANVAWTKTTDTRPSSAWFAALKTDKGGDWVEQIHLGSNDTGSQWTGDYVEFGLYDVVLDDQGMIDLTTNKLNEPVLDFRNEDLEPIGGGTFTNWVESSGFIDAPTWTITSGAVVDVAVVAPGGVASFKDSTGTDAISFSPSASDSQLLDSLRTGVIYAEVYLTSGSTLGLGVFRSSDGLKVVRLDCNSSQRLLLFIGDGVGNSNFTASVGNELSLLTWHKIAFRQNGTEVELWIDGVNVGVTKAGSYGSDIWFNDVFNDLAEVINEVHIGTNITARWSGNISDFKLYTRSLSDAEMVELTESKPILILKNQNLEPIGGGAITDWQDPDGIFDKPLSWTFDGTCIVDVGTVPPDGVASTNYGALSSGNIINTTANDQALIDGSQVGVIYLYMYRDSTGAAGVILIRDAASTVRASIDTNAVSLWRIFFHDGGNVIVAESVTGSEAPTNAWFKVGIRQDGTEISMWQNGVRLTMDSGANTTKWFKEIFADGGKSAEAVIPGQDISRRVRGNIADFALYNVSLSDAEMIALTTL